MLSNNFYYSVTIVYKISIYQNNWYTSTLPVCSRLKRVEHLVLQERNYEVNMVSIVISNPVQSFEPFKFISQAA